MAGSRSLCQSIAAINQVYSNLTMCITVWRGLVTRVIIKASVSLLKNTETSRVYSMNPHKELLIHNAKIQFYSIPM